MPPLSGALKKGGYLFNWDLRPGLMQFRPYGAAQSHLLPWRLAIPIGNWKWTIGNAPKRVSDGNRTRDPEDHNLVL